MVCLPDVFYDIKAAIYGSALDKGISWDFSGDSVFVRPYVITNPLYLRQIFLNIYGNSIKFTNPGGKISTKQECIEEKDNELNAEVAEILLEDEGAIITMVTDGQQAVELFNNNPEGTFDAILMDIMMPVMDGLTATRTTRTLERQDAKTIPIIAMTANAFEEDKRNAFAAGMDGFLSKPIMIEELIRTLQNTMEMK